MAIIPKDLEKFFIEHFNKVNKEKGIIARFKDLSKTQQRKYLDFMYLQYRKDIAKRARATQHFITTDPKTGKKYNSFTVMTRKIARNMARKKAGGNKGLRYEFEQIWYPIKNN